VWWLFAGSFVNRFGSFVSVFLILYLVDRGYSAPQAGAVAAPTSSAYVAELAPGRLRGRYQGAYGLTFALSLILAPAVGTWVYAWSPTGLWLLCGVVAAISAALLVRLPGRRIRDPSWSRPTWGPRSPARSASSPGTAWWSG
jgi:hypothetical protein